MKKVIAVLMVMVACGCSSLTQNLPGTPADRFAACKIADVISTKIALSGGAVEANPLLAKVIAKVGFGGLVAVSLGAIWLMYELQDRQQIDPTVVDVIAGVTCGIAVNNMLQ